MLENTNEYINEWERILEWLMEIADDCDIGSQQYILIIYSFKENYFAL